MYIAANLHFLSKATPTLPTSRTRVSLYITLPTQIHCRIDTNTSMYLHKYISVFSHGCGSPVPGYINNGLATHDEREMPRHISSYCGANCTNIPNMRLHIRAGRVCAYTRARDGGVYGWWWRGELGGGSIRTGRSRSRPPPAPPLSVETTLLMTNLCRGDAGDCGRQVSLLVLFGYSGKPHSSGKVWPLYIKMSW